MQAIIKLNPDFDALHSEQANFEVTLPEQNGAFAGYIRVDYSVSPHKVELDFVHPYMTALAQVNALKVAADLLDSHVDESAEPKSEWAGDLYLLG